MLSDSDRRCVIQPGSNACGHVLGERAYERMKCFEPGCALSLGVCVCVVVVSSGSYDECIHIPWLPEMETMTRTCCVHGCDAWLQVSKNSCPAVVIGSARSCFFLMPDIPALNQNFLNGTVLNPQESCQLHQTTCAARFPTGLDERARV